MYIQPNKLENNQADETVFYMLLKDQALISSQFSDVAFEACGNTNLRTGEEDDFVPGDGAKYNYLAVDYDPDVAIKRYSKDKLCTKTGRLQLNYCQESGIRILNGRMGEDRGVGEITFTQTGQIGHSVIT